MTVIFEYLLGFSYISVLLPRVGQDGRSFRIVDLHTPKCMSIFIILVGINGIGFD